MFDRLSEPFQRALQRASHSTLTDDDLEVAFRELRRDLLEADVPLEVVRPFLDRVGERARGVRRLAGIAPTEQLTAAVHDELVRLLGPVDTRLPTASPDRPAVILLLGLQGSGKTTTAAKLARYALKRGRHPLLVAADLQRPAAAEQLTVLAESIEVPVFAASDVQRSRLGTLLGRTLTPAEVCRQGIAQAAATQRDLVILDTAGRLHADEALLDELRDVAQVTRPDQAWLVCDAMSGQDALRSARAFSQAVDFGGVILTKTDGDARGGAALAVKAITGQPIKFLGSGEKLDGLEAVRPEGLASRILGRGDVSRLVELAREHVDVAQAERSKARLLRGELDFNDYLDQLQATQAIGLKRLLGLMPGMGALRHQVSDDALAPLQSMIRSMTPTERKDPALLSGRTGGRRRRRIARGAGRRVQDVNRMLKEFKQARRLVASLLSGGHAAGGPLGPLRGQPTRRPPRPRRRRRRR